MDSDIVRVHFTFESFTDHSARMRGSSDAKGITWAANPTGSALDARLSETSGATAPRTSTRPDPSRIVATVFPSRLQPRRETFRLLREIQLPGIEGEVLSGIVPRSRCDETQEIVTGAVRSLRVIARPRHASEPAIRPERCPRHRTWCWRWCRSCRWR